MERKMKKKPAFCCVPGCEMSHDKSKSYHKPKEEYKKKWMKALKLSYLNPGMVVCSNHFKKADFFPFGPANVRHKLKPGVVPSENIPVTLLTEARKDPILVQNRLERAEKRSAAKLKSFENASVSEQQTFEDPENSHISTEVNNISNVDTNYDDGENNTTESIEIQTDSATALDKGVQVIFCENTCLYRSFIQNDTVLNSFTGISSFEELEKLTECLQHLRNSRKKVRSSDLALEDCLVLTLIKLKLNLPYVCLSGLFKIKTVSVVSKVFIKTLKDLFVILSPLVRWPSKDEILDNMPLCFEKFRKTRVVVDCLEIPIEKSKCLKCRNFSYSFYKKTHTIKLMIGVTPSGLISFISDAYGGRVSDKVMFLKSNLISLMLPTADAVMVDKGFLIQKECEEAHIRVYIPPFLSKAGQFSKEDAEQTSRIAAARVHVERRIQVLRTFSILKDKLQNELIPFIDIVTKVICGLVNLKTPILAPDKF